MEKKQLATEWLMEQLYENVEIIGGGNVLDALLDEAKQMEKQQIKDAWDNGAYGTYESKIDIETSQEYYNETFKPE